MPCTRSPWGRARAARRRRGPCRAPGGRWPYVEMVATFGFSEEEVGSWRRFPARARRRSATPSCTAGRSSSTRASESAYPESGGRGRRPRRYRCAPVSRCSARSASASSAGTSSTTRSASSRSRWASNAPRARARPRLRRRAPQPRALSLLAAIGERLARSLEPDAALSTLADSSCRAGRPVRRRPRRGR